MFVENQQGLKKKKVFLMVVCLFVTYFLSDIYAADVFEKIIKLERENQKLNKKIVKELVFKLSENRTFDYRGNTCKYLLEDEQLGDLWLFKVYTSLFPVNATTLTYRLAQLLAVDISEITPTILPINERKRYGTIQTVIPKVKAIKTIPFNKLSSKQIECIMKNQLLDWIVFNTDQDGKELLVEKDTGKIIAIDKDETFYDQEKIISLNDNIANDSYYYEFWEAYIKGEVQITDDNFKKIFKLIDYFQTIKDKDIMYLLKKVMNWSKDGFETKTVIMRKQNLRTDFENFYRNVTGKGNYFFQILSRNNNNVYAQIVLENIETGISRKKSKLTCLKLKKHGKQKNIERISCSDAWYLVKKLNNAVADGKREKIFSLSNEINKKLNCLKKEIFSIKEQFVVELYIEEIRKFKNKKGIESFIQKEIKQIILYPEQITSRKILGLECNLRLIYGKPYKKFNEYKKNIEKNPGDILVHLDYFRHAISEDEDEKSALILENEYKKRLRGNSVEVIDKVLYGILLGNEKYLEKIDKDCAWKHLGIALVRCSKRSSRQAIKFYNKASVLNENSCVSYWAHILLGFFYEHNSNGERFGEGFDVEKSFKEYKKAAMINAKSVKAHLNLGTLYLINNQPQKALSEFKKVNELDSQYGRKHFHFDRINNEKSYKDKEEYLEAVRMNTLSGRHHYILGLAYLIKEDENVAQKHFHRARELGYKVKKCLLN